jgi:hypothetical protein
VHAAAAGAALDSRRMRSWSLVFTSASRGRNSVFLGVAPVVPRVAWAASPYCRAAEWSVETREVGRMEGRVREGRVEGNVRKGKMKGVSVGESEVGLRSALMRAVTEASYPVCLNSPDR